MTRAYDTYKELVRVQATLRAERDNLDDEVESLKFRIDNLESLKMRLTDLAGSVIRILENEYGGDWDVGE